MKHFVNVFFITFIAYLYFVKPRMKRKSVKCFIGMKFAHRGLHNTQIPENTLPAFKNAVDSGVGIELDVCLTKDGKIVVFHDNDLVRACNINKKITDINYIDLEKYKIFNSDYSIPTLDEVLKTVDGKIPILIEIKPDSRIMSLRICRETAKILDNYKGKFCIESFNPIYLAWFRYHRPKVARGQLLCKIPYMEKKRYILLIFVLRSMILNVLSRPDFVAYQYDNRRLVSVLLCRMIFRIPLFAWTVTDDLIDSQALKKYHSFIYEEN